MTDPKPDGIDISGHNFIYYDYQLNEEQHVCVFIFNLADLNKTGQFKANVTHMRTIERVEMGADERTVTVLYDGGKDFRVYFGEEEKAFDQAKNYCTWMKEKKERSDQDKKDRELLGLLVLALLTDKEY